MTPTAAITAIVRAPDRAGLVLDFDGTLAPIVDDPAASQLSEGTADVLVDLARVLELIAIVSGRPASFLADRAAVPGVRLLGLYGTEEWRDGGVLPRPEALVWRAAVDEASDRLALAIAGHPGVVLEDKGLAVALHWRNAADRDAAGAFVDQVAAQVAEATGLKQEPGKFVAELRPPLQWDKGTTVTELVADHDLATVVYIGDDRGDLPALAAAHAAGGVAVVVDHGPETPAQVRAAADVVLEGAQGVVTWLSELHAALGC